MDIRQLQDDDGEHAALHDLGGDGPALLLTHGNGLNAGMWATVVPHLRATFRCFGLDFRGHGASRQAH
jgi:pimeloyl-ACP methyl ester carboxylesterase